MSRVRAPVWPYFFKFFKYAVDIFYPAPCSSFYLVKVVAVVLILVAMLINIFSVKLSKTLQSSLFYSKLVVLMIIILIGVVNLCNGQTRNFRAPFKNSNTNFWSYAEATYSGSYSYSGWEVIIIVLEELKNPKKNIPLSILLSLSLVTTLYILANIAYLTVLSPTEIMQSSTVATDFAYRTMGKWAIIVPIGVALSCFGALNGAIMSAGRQTSIPGRYNHVPKFFSFIHTKYFTPVIGILFNGIVAALYMLPNTASFSKLLSFFSFVGWIWGALSALALIVFRYREPWKSKARSFKVPLPVAVFVLLFSIYELVAPFIYNPDYMYFIAVGAVLIGTIIYVPIHVWKWEFHKPLMRWITLKIQLLLSLAPEEKYRKFK